MQGSWLSSDSIWTAFDATTTAEYRLLKHQLKVSWTRQEGEDAGFATVGTSLISGTDILKGLGGVFTNADTYSYFDETDRVIDVAYDRQIVGVLGGIYTALLDVNLENLDGRFTPDNNSTIGTAILPNRPVDAKVGFRVNSQDKLISVFSGLTKTPKDDYEKRQLKFQAVDYVKLLLDYKMDSASYSAQRSDEIIQDILNELGFGSSQYQLDTGLNTIGYAYFEKTETAGQRIAKVCESEGGVFYQDETGILIFKNRNSITQDLFDGTQWFIDQEDIVDWEEDNSAKIYNSVTVKAKPRIVQTTQEIWRDGIEEEIEAGASITVWANLDDPANSIEDIADTTDYTAFTGAGGTGSDITSDISIVQSKFATACKLVITNNSGSKAYLNLLKLRGDPAIVQGQILEIVEDTDSINKYGEEPLVIENDFIDKRTTANELATFLVNNYSTSNRRIKITVQGIPQLQLWDRVKVWDTRTNAYLPMRIDRIQGDLVGGAFIQKLHLRERPEDLNKAIVGTDEIGDTDHLVF